MSDLFYRNKRLLQLVLALIVAGGVSSYQVLPRTEDPRLTKRVSLIQTVFPGASAEEVESLVTEKIEEQLDEIEEINKLDSTSRAGISVIRIELNEEIPEEAVPEIWSRVRDKVGDAQPDLPAAVPQPQFNETATEIDAYTLIVGLTWTASPEHLVRPHDVYQSGVGYATLRRLGEELADEMRLVPGTKQAELFGNPTEEILVRVAPETLASLELSAAEVARRIEQSDARAPAGQLRGASSDLLLEVEGELDSLDRVRNVPVSIGSDGRVVRVADLGAVEKTMADPPDELAIISGKAGIAVAARMEDGLRIDQFAAALRTTVEDFGRYIPDGVRMEILFDQSAYVEERLSGLQRNLMLGVVLVMAIVWVTMGWRSALLIGSALPISALIALTGMRILGLPIHQMSITGLIVALGLLIDNAIVMVDEVRQRLDDGEPPRTAVGASVRHLAIPLFSSTLTTIFAFMPIVLLPGGGGEFVGPIAVSVILALIGSLFAALTIVPALTGMFARGATEAYGPWWRDGFSDEDLGGRYRGLLRTAFSRPWAAMGAALTPAVAGFLLMGQLQEQFFPPADRDQFQIQLRLPMQSSIEHTLRYAGEARRILTRHDKVEEVHWFIGDNAPKFYYNMLGGDAGSPFYAQALVNLESNEGYFNFIREVQTELDEAFPSAQFLALQLEQGPPFQAPIEMHISGPDLATLDALGARVRTELTQTSGVTHTLTSLRDGRPKILLGVDEEELRLAGLDNIGAARQLQAAFDGAAGGSLIEGTEELPVRVVLKQDARGSVAELASLDLMRSGGAARRTPVESVASLDLVPELAAITHRRGVRTNTVRGFIQSGLLPSVVLSDFRERLDASGFELPPGYAIAIGGEAEQRNDAVGDLLANISLLVIGIVATLVLAFNSFRMAAVILSVAGFAMGFAFLMLFIFNYPFGFVAIVGSMGLIGVAVNDSIVVLAALREDEAAAGGDLDSLVETVVRATRHVLTTTLTTMAGFSPLLIAGGDFWPPLAVALGGGVVGATVMALLFVPAAFRILTRRSSEARVAQPAPAAS